MEKIIENKCKQLSINAKDLYLPSEVKPVYSLSSLEFLRYVSSNIPVLVRGVNRNWAAVKKWEPSYFRKTFPEKVVSVTVTPNGYADAIVEAPSGEEYFVEPEERKMKLTDFLDILDAPEDHHGVFYIQQQNSNLKHEFQELIDDIPEDIPFASEALNSKPDAVNFWMGDERAVTSMHKDPFENIYCVISGFKHFILHPPTDRPWIPYKFYPPAKYCETVPGKFEIVPQVQKEDEDHDDGYLLNSKENTDKLLVEATSDFYRFSDLEQEPKNLVPWISIDPLQPDLKTYPLYKNSTTVTVQVGPGDLLYIPSLWFHHVQQSHGCIAINYWYDMEYDIKYTYYKFLESLCPVNGNTASDTATAMRKLTAKF